MAVPIVMPKLGMVMSEGTVASWRKKVGEIVTSGEVLAEIETEKINYDLEATADGVFHPVVEEGAIIPVDGLLGYLLADGEGVPELQKAVQPTGPAPKPKPLPRRKTFARRPGAPVRSSPGARRLAAKLGVDIESVNPSGPGGRIVEKDVRDHLESTPKLSMPAGLPQPSKTITMEGIRKSIADHMRKSIGDTAQLSFFLEIDVTDAQRLRREASDGAETTISMAHVILKACAQVLKRYPEPNTILVGGNILYFDEVSIGFAVALKEGLVVPVVRDAHEKSMFDIAEEVESLVSDARDGKLLPDAMSGGTFTISVLGSVDGFTPILNAGQSAILGAGRSLEKPVVRKGDVVVREMMTISLTVDHQVIDGAVAASFLRRFQQAIERPGSLFK